MISEVKTLCHVGLNVFEVLCQCHISNGLPIFNIVGMADKSIQESKERVRVVLNELSKYDEDISYPYARITVNLAPAEVVKKGNQYDLAIILGILNYQGYIPKESLENSFFLGELSLDGSVNQVNSIVSYCLYLNEKYPNCKIYIPAGNELEASYLTNGNIYSVSNITEIIEMLKGKKTLIPIKTKIDNTEGYQDVDVSLEDVIGQLQGKRAIEISAAGGHNLLMIGEQGSGKTLLSRVLNSLLPTMDRTELLEVAKIRSLVGEPTASIMSPYRPFRSPHHTSSMISIIGGGNKIVPGEITKAHNGVLFLDELTEYDKRTLDSLRQPLEDKVINISRVNHTITYPCNFQLIATMNPSNKGGFENNKDIQANSGMKKVSGPILDRFDLQLKIYKPKNMDLNSNIKTSTTEVRARITSARKIQLARLGQGKNNSSMTISQINEFCVLTHTAKEILDVNHSNGNISMRSLHKILKLSRTIADLDGKELIEDVHLYEALSLRF